MQGPFVLPAMVALCFCTCRCFAYPSLVQFLVMYAGRSSLFVYCPCCFRTGQQLTPVLASSPILLRERRGAVRQAGAAASTAKNRLTGDVTPGDTCRWHACKKSSASAAMGHIHFCNGALALLIATSRARRGQVCCRRLLLLINQNLCRSLSSLISQAARRLLPLRRR
jgi:hypothetical protein